MIKRILILLISVLFFLCMKEPYSPQMATTGLQGLIDATPIYGTLTLDGIYLVDSPVNITKPITIRGSRNAVIQFTNVKDWRNYYDIATGGSGDGAAKVGIINIISDHVTIYGITVDQNYRNSGRGNGEKPMIGSILLGGYYTGSGVDVHDVIIRQCAIYDVWGNGICGFNKKSSGVTIDSNEIYSAGVVRNFDTLYGALLHGDQMISIASGDTVNITDNNIYGTADDAIAVHSQSTLVNILRNNVQSQSGRILMSGCTNSNVKYNRIDVIRNAATGIYITFGAEASVLSMNEYDTVAYNTIVSNNAHLDQAIYLFGCGNHIYVGSNYISAGRKDSTQVGISIRPRTFTETGDIYSGTYIKLENNRMPWVYNPVFMHADVEVDSVTIINTPATF